MKTVTITLVVASLFVGTRFIANHSKSAHADDAKPEHSKTDEANASMAKGRALAREAQSPANLAEKAEVQKKARECFAEARDIFQADHDRHKKAYDKYDKFIPKNEKEKYEARELAYRQYIQAQLHLAVLRYEEAQSWDKGSADNKKLLTEAADAFDKIHARYRQMVAGLYARMWEGKCFEELNDLGKAMGLYNELLGHNGAGSGKQNPVLADLQDRVRHFRLICLNRKERQDYQLVIKDAEEWLQDNSAKTATRSGLGIQWELVRALEFQARSERTSDAEKTRLLEKAVTTAKAIHSEPGEFKDSAAATIERLEAEIKGKSDDEK